MNDKKIKVALAQFQVEPFETKINMAKMTQLIEDASKQNADIICFPELSLTGYSPSGMELQRLSQRCDGEFVQQISALGRKFKIHIIAGYSECVDFAGRLYNSCIFVDDEGGIVGNVRKIYGWTKEKQKFYGGDKLPVFKTKLGNISILMCYDIEFPEPSRIVGLKGAEMVFVPAAWSTRGDSRWHTALGGNALFNLMYMVGVNPVGNHCCGSSKVVSPFGDTLHLCSKDQEELLICDIDMAMVAECRSELPYYNDFKPETFSMEAVTKF